MQPKHLLSGVVVVDFTQFLAGPSVSQAMAELGAEVIKVEQAKGGDPSRSLPFVKEGRSIYYIQQNRGKKSLCIDPRHPKGQEILRALVVDAHIGEEKFTGRMLEEVEPEPQGQSQERDDGDVPARELGFRHGRILGGWSDRNSSMRESRMPRFIRTISFSLSESNKGPRMIKDSLS